MLLFYLSELDRNFKKSFQLKYYYIDYHNYLLGIYNSMIRLSHNHNHIFNSNF